MMQTAKELSVSCVISADVVNNLRIMPNGVEARGAAKVHGIAEPVSVYAYSTE